MQQKLSPITVLDLAKQSLLLMKNSLSDDEGDLAQEIIEIKELEKFLAQQPRPTNAEILVDLKASQRSFFINPH